MQLTIQARPPIAPESESVLDRVCDYYGVLKRKLYAKVAKGGGQAKDYKTEFCKQYGITARFFNGLRNDLQGMIDSVHELLRQSIKDKKQAIKNLKQRLFRLDKKLEAVTAKKIAVTNKVFTRWTKLRRKFELKIECHEASLDDLKGRLAANVPGIGFGSRKLFAKQFSLTENGYANHAEWLADWRSARNHECFFLGSGDETGGNQSCTLFVGEDGLLALRIRLPDEVVAATRQDGATPDAKLSGADKYLVLRGLTFPYDEIDLRRALRDGKALSWLIHKDHKGRLMVSFARPAVAKTTLSAQFGAIGIDFNSDHLAVTETDATGNICKTRRLELPFDGKSTGRRDAILSSALEQVVDYALAVRKPIAAEELDFADKKKDMTAMTPAQARARALSGLAYAKYQQLLASKCHRRGVELIKVDPAYTSLAGLVKYAKPLGISVHKAAAGVIARRAQGCKENLPREVSTPISIKGVTAVFRLPARNRQGDGGTSSWKEIHAALGKFRREMVAAQRKSDARAGTSRGVKPRGPSGGTVTPAGYKSKSPPQSGEQICS